MSVPTRSPAVVVGAGPSGLATAVALKDHGVGSVVVEQADQVGSTWRRRYDRLRLNTWRRNSHPPGRPFPRGVGKFPTRDDMVGHLDALAAEDGLDIRLGTRVERIDRADQRPGWVVRTDAGAIEARQVVVATGYEGAPAIPDWPGRDAFGRPLVHSGEYRNPAPYRGRSVLVVGPGCSGMEIAHDLAEGGAEQVRLAVRTAPSIMLREGPGGLPGDVIGCVLWHAPVRLADAVVNFARRRDVGDLSEFGLAEPEEGVFARLQRLGVAPSIVDREVVGAIRARRIEIVAAVEAMHPGEVELADGTRIEPDAVICATGYRRALEPLVGHLGVLDEGGAPRAVGRAPAAPGLRFVGYVPRPGGLGYMGREAGRAARAIAAELDGVPRGRGGGRARPGSSVAVLRRRRGARRARPAAGASMPDG